MKTPFHFIELYMIFVCKFAPWSLLIKLIALYSKIYKESNVPESFIRSIIYPLYKKGDIIAVENYRRQSFIGCIAKIFESLLNNRLENGYMIVAY